MNLSTISATAMGTRILLCAMTYRPLLLPRASICRQRCIQPGAAHPVPVASAPFARYCCRTARSASLAASCVHPSRAQEHSILIRQLPLPDQSHIVVDAPWSKPALCDIECSPSPRITLETGTRTFVEVLSVSLGSTVVVQSASSVASGNRYNIHFQALPEESCSRSSTWG
ncbi:hypothetical protein BDW66DRAFT_145325 [Aspergillus desertorum]